MDIKITGKHIDITETIRAEIEEKVSGLPKFYSSVIDAEVIVEGGKEGATNSVEIIARAKHNHIFVAKEVGQDIFGCVEEVIRKIERQITKQKQKERDNKHIRKITEE